MSDWVNWQQFAEANAPEVQRQNAATEEREASQRAQMDSSLRSLSGDAMGWANAGQHNSLAALGSYGDLMAGAKADSLAAPGAQQGAPWDADLGRNTYASPWGKLSEKLGGIQANASNRIGELDRQHAAEQQQAEARAWNANQQSAADRSRNGKAQDAGAQYAAWSDAVNRSAQHSGGIGAGAYYDAAQGNGSPWMAPSNPRQDAVNNIYRRNPSNIPSSNFGNTNNAGGTIFTGNWSF